MGPKSKAAAKVAAAAPAAPPTNPGWVTVVVKQGAATKKDYPMEITDTTLKALKKMITDDKNPSPIKITSGTDATTWGFYLPNAVNKNPLTRVYLEDDHVFDRLFPSLVHMVCKTDGKKKTKKSSDVPDLKLKNTADNVDGEPVFLVELYPVCLKLQFKTTDEMKNYSLLVREKGDYVDVAIADKLQKIKAMAKAFNLTIDEATEAVEAAIAKKTASTPASASASASASAAAVPTPVAEGYDATGDDDEEEEEAGDDDEEGVDQD